MWRKIRTSPALRQIMGRSVAAYLKLVWKTQRTIIEPSDSGQTRPDLNALPSRHPITHPPIGVPAGR